MNNLSAVFFLFRLKRRYTPILLAALRHNAVAASVLLKAGAITNIRTVTCIPLQLCYLNAFADAILGK